MQPFMKKLKRVIIIIQQKQQLRIGYTQMMSIITFFRINENPT